MIVFTNHTDITETFHVQNRDKPLLHKTFDLIEINIYQNYLSERNVNYNAQPSEIYAASTLPPLPYWKRSLHFPENFQIQHSDLKILNTYKPGRFWKLTKSSMLLLASM